MNSKHRPISPLTSVEDGQLSQTTNSTLHKDKEHKPRCDLLVEYFPNALLEISKICGYGARKYGEHTWQDVDYRDYKAAMFRHALYGENEECDSETGMSHECHLAWNTLAMLELYLTKEGIK